MIKRTELRKAFCLSVVHKKTGRHYSVVGVCKMKNSTTREWENAVMYVGTDTKTGKWTTFVREIKDFQKEFENI